MNKLYRIEHIATGRIMGDFIIESDNAILLSDDYRLSESDDLASTLPDLQIKYIQDVNIKASLVRRRFMTLYPGQEFTYTKKLKAAVAYKKATNPVDVQYPYLYNEATALDMTLLDLAKYIIQKEKDSDDVNVIIEAQRRRGIKQIKNAIDLVELKEVKDFALASLDAHQP